MTGAARIAVVLGGGRSSRMGTDKLELTLATQTLLARTCDAALAWAETLTRVVGQSISNDAYGSVRRHFSEEEVAFLSVSIATINAWNRLGAAFRFAPPIQKGVPATA